jgi:putative restriction endonuclease
MATPEQWLAKLAALRVDRKKGDPAPHKPLLLLAVLELAEQARLSSEKLALTPDLSFRFISFWKIVAHRRRQKPDVRYPFHHLKTDGCWSAFDEDGRPSSDRKQTRYVAIPSDFLAFVNNPAYRDQARRLLIAKYFEPQERAALYTMFGMPIPSEDQVVRDANYRAPEDAQKRGREVRFRINVVAAYDYTCALTGYRLTTVSGASVVDAAHIHQFADSRNNNLNNGVALCKNAHWLFDNGLWTISDDYRVIVAVGRFSENGPDEGAFLRSYHGQPLHFPPGCTVRPDHLHIAWHRKHKFQGS